MAIKIKRFKEEQISHARIHSGIIPMFNQLERSDLQTLIILSYLNDWKDGSEQATFNGNQLANAFDLNPKSIRNSIDRLVELQIFNNNSDVLSLNIDGLNAKLTDLKEMTKKIVPTKAVIKKQLQNKEIEKAQSELALLNRLLNAGIQLTEQEQEKYDQAKEIIAANKPQDQQPTPQQQIEAFDAEISISNESIRPIINQQPESIKQAENSEKQSLIVSTSTEFDDILNNIKTAYNNNELIKNKVDENQYIALIIHMMAGSQREKKFLITKSQNDSKAVLNYFTKKFDSQIINNANEFVIVNDMSDCQVINSLNQVIEKFNKIIAANKPLDQQIEAFEAEISTPTEPIGINSNVIENFEQKRFKENIELIKQNKNTKLTDEEAIAISCDVTFGDYKELASNMLIRNNVDGVIETFNSMFDLDSVILKQNDLVAHIDLSQNTAQNQLYMVTQRWIQLINSAA